MRLLHLATLFILTSLSLNAETILLTLDEALRLAIEQSIDLKKNEIDLNLASFKANRLWAEIFPSLSVGGGVTYGNPLFAGEPGRNPFGVNGTVSLSLQFNGGLPAAMRNITLAYQSRLLSYDQAQRQLELQISKTFFNLKAEQENLKLLEDVRRLAESQFAKNEVAFRNGYIGEMTYQRSLLDSDGAKLNLFRALSQHRTNVDSFLTMLGIEPNAGLELEGVMEVYEISIRAEDLISNYLLKRPDIVFQHKHIESLENSKRQIAWASRGPSLNLQGQWRGNFIDAFSDNLNGSLTLTLPIDPWIPGTKGDQSVRTADAEIRKARLDLENLENTGKTDIRSRTNQINSSWATIQTARLRVQTAQRAYELTEQGFLMGTVESLDLETVRKDMVEARQQLLNEELSYRNMILDLAAAINADWHELMSANRRR